MAGLTITIIGGLIAGIERLWDPVRLVYLVVVLGVTALAMISFMFLLMVRVNDPLVPRAIFGVLNTLLFFPSGAIYPTEGFRCGCDGFRVVDPFTYAVHALKNLLLKNTGLSGIYGDIGVLAGFAIVFISLSIFFFNGSSIEYGRDPHSNFRRHRRRPQTKMRRYVIMLVALVVIVVGGGFWAYFSFLTCPRKEPPSASSAPRGGRYAAGLSALACGRRHYSYKDFWMIEDLPVCTDP